MPSRMDSHQHISLIYAKSLSDIVRFLNGTPFATGLRVEMGLRFWGSPSKIREGMSDPDLDEDREDLVDALRDHPSLEVLEFRGPSPATYADLAMLLKGVVDHSTFQSLIIPVIPLEWYCNPTEKSNHLKNVTSMIHKSKTLTNLYITNGTNHPGDYPYTYGEHLDSRMTRVFQRAINSILLVNMTRRRRAERESRM